MWVVGVLAVGDQKNPPKIAESTLVQTGREIAHAQKRNPLSNLVKFCKVVGKVVSIPDAITYANLGDDRLRGLWVAGVKFCHPTQAFVVILLNTHTTGIIMQTCTKITQQLANSVQRNYCVPQSEMEWNVN